MRFDRKNNPIPQPAKRKRRRTQHNLVFALEMLSALAGAAAIIVGSVYALGRFCWWAVPNSRGGGGRSGCGNLVQYAEQRLADPDFIPTDIISTGWWFVYLAVTSIGFLIVAFFVSKVLRGSGN